MARPKRSNGESYKPDHPAGSGYWEGRVTMGVKADGTPDRRTVRRKTKASRDKAVRAHEKKRDAGLVTNAGRPKTVKGMLDRHLDVVLLQRGRAPWTIASYRSLCEQQVYPRWGGQRIDRLLPEHVEDGYAAMLAGDADHKPLSASTVRKVHAVCSSAYEIEVKRGNVARNPFRLVEPPRLAEPDKAVLTIEQARRVLAVVAGRRNAARWSVGLACGLRQGETLGLRWRYVDLDAGQLQVWYQLQRLPNGGGLAFREIKERRRKTVKLPAELVTVLKSHRAAQAGERLAAGDVWQDHDLVFAQPNGRPIGQKTDWQEWSDILSAAGIEHAGTHAMRHSAATIALGEGVALAVVQEMLGHSDIRMTRVYTHVSSPLADDAAQRMGRALFGTVVPKVVPINAEHRS